MKKNALIAVSMIMLSVFSMTFTSCSSDDDDAPVLTTPKYADDAVPSSVALNANSNTLSDIRFSIPILIFSIYSYPIFINGITTSSKWLPPWVIILSLFLAKHKLFLMHSQWS